MMPVESARLRALFPDCLTVVPARWPEHFWVVRRGEAPILASVKGTEIETWLGVSGAGRPTKRRKE